MKRTRPCPPCPRLRVFVASVWLVVAFGAPVARAEDQSRLPSVQEARFEEHIQPLLEEHCYACHASAIRVADFDLEELVADYPDSLVRDFRRWETVAEQVITGSMPPAGQARRPSTERRRFLTNWIDSQLETSDLSWLDEPGAPLVRRLNRAEFHNTIRDLTGVEIDVSRFLPSDGLSEDGLPNNGNSLFLAPSDIEKLVRASELVLAHAEVSPTLGIVFRAEPRPKILHAERVHRAAVNLAGYYNALVSQHLERGGEALAGYFVAAWEAKSLAHASDSFRWSDVAVRHGLETEVLQRLAHHLGVDYRNYHAEKDGVDFEQLGEFRAHFDALFQPFQSLPLANSPEQIAQLRPRAEEAAERFQAVLETFREDVDYTYALPGGDHSHPFEIDVSGQSQVFLLVTNGGDENDADYVAWIDAAFHMADGTVRAWTEKDPVDAIGGESEVARNANSLGNPLHIFTQASYLAGVRNRLYEEPLRMNRENPLYRENTIPWEHVLAVRAPSLLALPVPDGATTFSVRGVMQDIARTHPAQERREWHEDGMVQFRVSTSQPETLAFVPGGRLTFAHPTQFRQFRRYLEDFVSDYFPSADRWIQVATENPGEPPRRAVFHLLPTEVAERLPANAGKAKKELLRLWAEYWVACAEPRFVREKTNEALNWERRMIAKDHAERVLTLQEVRALAGSEAKERIGFLDQLLVEGKRRSREAYERQLTAFATKAFRRPVRPDEGQRLMGLYDQTMQDDKAYSYDAVRFAAQSVLVAPQFLYVSEREAEPGGIRRIDSFELANRISYFLWSTMPDEELRRLAQDGVLGDASVLQAQAARMLRDRRSVALADQFVGNWLEFREIREYDEPDRNRFPEYTDSLREAMYQESLMFVHEVIRQDRSILDLVDADFTYVNEELALHYGLPGIRGPAMRRVALSDRSRGGLLGMASVLTLTSHPARTSPVERGAFILKNLLDSSPPPPPPNAPSRLQEQQQRGIPVSFREQLEAHRRDPGCAACHRRLDPLGFALENFDAVGRYRTAEDRTGEAVDTRAELPDGTPVGSLDDVRRALLTGREKKKFVRTFCRRLLAYALARSLTFQDLGTLRRIESQLEASEYRFSAAVASIVGSRAFRYRQAAPAPGHFEEDIQAARGRAKR